MGRWSWFLAPYCREMVLVDFSEAIFVARQNLSGRGRSIFIMADIRRLPFGPDFADLIYSLGVLHHLPTPALDEVVRLRPYSARLLIYLYYALDNRPWYFRALLTGVNAVRLTLSRVRNTEMRGALTWLLALTVYLPLIGLGHLLRPLGLDRHVPLHEGYRGRSLSAIRQDVYDRFFTGIEQRFSRAEIRAALEPHFTRVVVGEQMPYWHFLCER
jgi:hypothetical protein